MRKVNKKPPFFMKRKRRRALSITIQINQKHINNYLVDGKHFSKASKALE